MYVSRKSLHVAFVALMITPILVYFQNCSQAPTGVSHYENDSEVRVIEDWAQGKVFISSNSFEIPESKDSLNIDGICDRKKESNITWELRSSDFSLLDRGVVTCLGGGFVVDLFNLTKLPCDSLTWFSVEDDSGQGGSSNIKRVCDKTTLLGSVE